MSTNVYEMLFRKDIVTHVITTFGIEVDTLKIILLCILLFLRCLMLSMRPFYSEYSSSGTLCDAIRSAAVYRSLEEIEGL